MKSVKYCVAFMLAGIITIACVLNDSGEAEFDPLRAYSEVTLVIQDLEAAQETFPDEEFLEELTGCLEQVQAGLNIYINGGGDGDALMTTLAAAQALVDAYRDDEDYKVYALLVDVALRRVRAALPAPQ